MLISCEHTTNFIPQEYQQLFEEEESVLLTHRAYDPGAGAIAEAISKQYKLPLIQTEVSRLLVETNRSLHHPDLFSEYSQKLNPDEKEKILQLYYHKHRKAVEDYVSTQIQEGNEVIHIGIHSFAPVLHGVFRNAQIGLLYDPAFEKEKHFAQKWKEQILVQNPYWNVRHNYPYKGKSDGLTTYLRNKYHQHYIGIELEVNQNLLDDVAFENTGKIIVNSLDFIMHAD